MSGVGSRGAAAGVVESWLEWECGWRSMAGEERMGGRRGEEKEERGRVV